MSVRVWFRRAALLFLLVMCLPLRGESYTMDELFRAMDWGAVDERLAASGGILSAREESIAANALWLQRRWRDALPLLEKNADHWPEEVKPYGAMMTILGLERTGRRSEAAAAAKKLLPEAPAELGYYVAYALYRLSDEKDTASRKGYLERMYALATEERQWITALSNLLALPGGEKKGYALALLSLQPRNAAALKVLEALPKPWNAEVYFALGYAAYLRGEHGKAVPLLKAVPLDSKNGRKARYYRAFSLYHRKQYGSALELWSYLARNGTSYAESSIRRISILAGHAERKRALRVLREVAESRQGVYRTRAYYSLSTNLSGDEKRAAEERVMELAPDSEFAAQILWTRGWGHWRAGRTKEAVQAWQHTLTSSATTSWRARILYWLAKGYDRLGESERDKKTLDLLTKAYPLTIYGILANGGKVPVEPGIPPAFEDTAPSTLEQWGFVQYARMNYVARGDRGSLFRAALLAAWMGDGQSTYAIGGRLSAALTKEPVFRQQALEILYPRPYRREVRAAAERFGVEDNFIWAIMRQESAFDPNATSWAGAAGLMQLMPATAKGEADALKMAKYALYTPEHNILLGAAYIARLLKSFGREELAAAAYNAGSGAARRWLGERKDPPLDEWIEAIRYKETSGYVQRVMANLAVYRTLYPADMEDLVPGSGQDNAAPEEALSFGMADEVPSAEEESTVQQGTEGGR